MKRTFSRVAGTAVLAAAILAGGQAAWAATWTGGSGDDVHDGTSSADTFHGMGGNDTLRGLEGGDILNGNTGNDVLRGGSGADDLDGGPDNDRLYGDAGQDAMQGADGADRVYGDGAVDVSGSGDLDGDTIRGGDGDDTMFARDGEADVVWCGAGAHDEAILDNADVLGGSDCEEVSRAAQASDTAATGHADRATEWANLYLGQDEDQLWTDHQLKGWIRRANYPVPSSPRNIAWCGVYVHELYYQAGVDLPDNIVSTDWLRTTTSSAFTVINDKTNIRRGDIILLDLPGGDGDDHMGVAQWDYASGDNQRVVVTSGNSAMDDGGPNGVDRDTYTFDQIVRVLRVN